MKKLVSIIVTICLSCILQSSLQAQSVQVTGTTSNMITVYNDTLAGATTKVLKPNAGHSGWIRTSDYKFFSMYVTFDKTGVTGFATSDTVKILMEQYADPDTRPVLATVGYYEAEDPGTVPTREELIVYDSTNITDNARTFFSFHGSGDPEIALSRFVRFYSKVVGGFTGAGLGMKLVLVRQP